MLARLGPPPKQDRPPRAERAADELEENEEAGDHQELASALRRNGGRCSAEDLFATAGYDRDLTREVESFYLELRESMGKTILSEGQDGGRSILKVTPDAT